jgi:hypothetical protein
LKQNEFVTACLYIASLICIVLCIQPEYKVENGKTLFVFPVSDDLYKVLNAYNDGVDGVKVNAYGFASMIKRLRAEMLMRRGMERHK